MLSYKIRDYFIHGIIGSENGEPFYGLPSLPWMLLQFAQNVLPRLKKGENIVVDHFIGDIYVDFPMDLGMLDKFLKNIGFPSLYEGHHIYLDIGSKAFSERAEREHTEIHKIPTGIFYEKRTKYRYLSQQGVLTQIDGNEPKEIVHEKIKEVICEPVSKWG